MTTSFYNGISGIKSSQSGINVLSDNILNVNTIGYKGSSAEFSTIFSKTLSGGSLGDVTSQIGLGSQMNATALDTSQGVLKNTNNVFDLALNSQGWFGVQGTDNKTYYTRAGLFNKDANGYLTNESGNYLLGTPGGNVTPTTLDQTTLNTFGKYYGTSSTHLADAYAISNIKDIPLGSVASQTKLKLPDLLYFPPVATTKVSYKTNLDPKIKYNTKGAEIPNIEHRTSSIISPSGNKDTLDMTFTKRVPQQTTGAIWDASILILGPAQTYDPKTTYDTNKYRVDTTAKKVYPIVDSKTGVLKFDSSGKLISSTVPTLSNGGVSLALNLGIPGTYDGLVSSTRFNISNFETHDGNVGSLVKDYGMDGNGNVIANFSNGNSIPITKVAVYHFRNAQGLNKVGSNLFSASQNSGNPFFYQDSSGKSILGTHISSNKLEGSNVNTATALTELIVIQKAFDASAKSITTSDQLIQNAINMKK